MHPGHLSSTSVMKGSVHSVQFEEESLQALQSVLQVSQDLVVESANFPFGHVSTHVFWSRKFPGWHVAQSVLDPVTHVKQPGSQFRQKLLLLSSVNPAGQFDRQELL